MNGPKNRKTIRTRLSLPVFLSLLLLPACLMAQDGRSFAIGGAATAAPSDIFGLYWNPAALALPNGSPSGWTVGSGLSVLDSSNAGSAILQFSPSNAQGSSQDPINRRQQYLGTFGVGFTNVAGGMLYDQLLDYSASQRSLAFFHDRDKGSLTGAYDLNYLQTTQQVGTLIVSYATQVPLGSFSFSSVGASLKYHDGLQFQQDQLTGTFTQGNSTGYQYTRTTSSSGLGLSVDGGFLVKMTDSLQFGMMFQNLQSSFSWQAQQESFNLDPTTGAETPVPGSSSSVTIQSPFPYATKLGLLVDPPGKDILLEGEVSWSQQQTHWRFGLERYYPANFIAVRFGTFYDDISQSQLWAFGFGYERSFLSLDLSFVTRSLPDIQNSIALGGAASAIVRF